MNYESKNNLYESLYKKTKTILLLFKLPSRWNPHVIRKINLQFNVVYVFASDFLIRGGTDALLSEVTEIVKKNNVDYIICDPEFFYFITPFTIRKLDEICTTGIFIFDHIIEENNIFLLDEASFALCADPSLSIELSQLGYSCEFFPLESDIFYAQTTKPGNDVFFFGTAHKDDRVEYIDALQSMNKVVVDIHATETGEISYKQLAQKISNAKITVNLSQIKGFSEKNSRFIYKKEGSKNFALGLKGRIQEVAFCNRLCVSQDTPQLESLGLSEVVPQFRNPLEMIALLKELLSSPKLESVNYKFCKSIKNVYSDRIISNNLVDFLIRIDSTYEAKREKKYNLEELRKYVNAINTAYPSELAAREIELLELTC